MSRIAAFSDDLLIFLDLRKGLTALSATPRTSMSSGIAVAKKKQLIRVQTWQYNSRAVPDGMD
jgi:hypothetical protein